MLTALSYLLDGLNLALTFILVTKIWGRSRRRSLRRSWSRLSDRLLWRGYVRADCGCLVRLLIGETRWGRVVRVMRCAEHLR